MNRFYYGENGKGKLVRDNLNEVIHGEGHVVESRQLESAGLSRAILQKIPEELQEISEVMDSGNRTEIVEELADLKSLTDSLQKAAQNAFGITSAEIDEAEKAKSAKKGSFEKGTFIEYVELNPDGKDYDFWLKHFRSNSDRYKESDEK